MGRHIQLISASASEYGHAGNLRRHHPAPVARNPLGVICTPLYWHVAKPLRLWVSAMTVDGPAQQAGVKLGDEVVLVDGATVESLGAFPAQMRLSSGYVTTGQTVQVGLSRAGEDVAVTLTATPAPTE